MNRDGPAFVHTMMHATTMDLPPRRHAFTLIEVVMVLSIIAVVSAIAIPRYAEALNRYHLDAAERRVRADVEMVRERCRAQGIARSITFVELSDIIVIAGVPDPSGRSSLYTIRLANAPYEVDLSIPGGDGAEPLPIDAYGEYAGQLTIVLTRGNSSRTIEFNVPKE